MREDCDLRGLLYFECVMCYLGFRIGKRQSNFYRIFCVSFYLDYCFKASLNATIIRYF